MTPKALEMKYWLALNAISGLGPRRGRELLKSFGNPEAILNASERRLREVSEIGDTLARKIVAWREEINIEKELELIAKGNIKVLTIEDSGYPSYLSKIFDPPLVLYVKGELLPKDLAAVAIVGSRRPSIYGKMTAEKLGRELGANGLTIISGMARGIDSAAHKGALSSGGRTIAVFGNGLGIIYPAENEALADDIAMSGAVISEFPMLTPPERGNFPRRNRIISGLSLGVVVVEAARRSGALITVDRALEQGKEVFAIPGRVDSPISWGTNNLIQQGAKIATTSDSIVEELEPLLRNLQQIEGGTKELKSSASGKLTPALGGDEKRLYELLSDAKDIDTIIAESGFSASKVSSTLTTLQIKKLIKEFPGKVFVRSR
ncbi:MAG: DNA processing protein DprA [Syntrophomonadaceae bacterium]|nr:DNA processing protein DprA [Bacillota bacterium]